MAESGNSKDPSDRKGESDDYDKVKGEEKAVSSDDNKGVASEEKAAASGDDSVISHNKGVANEEKAAASGDDSVISHNKGALYSSAETHKATLSQQISFGRPIPPYLQKHPEAVDINSGFEASGRVQERSAWGTGTGEPVKKVDAVTALSTRVERKVDAAPAVSRRVERARAFWKRAFEVARKHDAAFPRKEKKGSEKTKKGTKGYIPLLIASKLMKMMGYVAGSGLGKKGQGILEPLEPTILPKHTSLEGAISLIKESEEKKKKKKDDDGKKKKKQD